MGLMYHYRMGPEKSQAFWRVTRESVDTQYIVDWVWQFSSTKRGSASRFYQPKRDPINQKGGPPLGTISMDLAVYLPKSGCPRFRRTCRAYNRKSGGNLWKQWSQLFINIEVASQTTMTGLRYTLIVFRKNMKKMKLKSRTSVFFPSHRPYQNFNLCQF